MKISRLLFTVHNAFTVNRLPWKTEKSKWLLFLAPALVSMGLIFSSGASAASNSKLSGITVSPAFQQVKVLQSETKHQLKFEITNHRPTAQALSLYGADFGQLNESGGLLFVGTNPTELQKKYGLAKWLVIPDKSITVQPGRTKTINAYISNDSSLGPGGHYGALMISLGSGQSSGKNNISVHPIASSLLFVTKLGGDTHKLSLSNVYFKHSLFSLPGSVTLRFYNDGNSHVIPRGTVTITAAKGTLISKGIINEGSGIILPETYRKYEVPLQKVSSTTAIGQYKLRVDFRFDGYDQYRSYQTGVWVLPLPIIASFVFLVLILAGAYITINKQIYRKKPATPKRKHAIIRPRDRHNK